MSERQTPGAVTGNSKPSAGPDFNPLHLKQQVNPHVCGSANHRSRAKTTSGSDEKKNDLPQDFDIDMENPETEKAAVAIQSQFRKFQKKKHDTKS